MSVSRIHIIGAPGSGKSYLARELARRYSLPHCQLDDLHWKNEDGSYGNKRSLEERAALLANVIGKPAWVIEGVYYKWLQPSFEAADAIVILAPGSVTRSWRLVRRHFSPNGRQQNIKQLYDLWRWGQDYARTTLPAIIEQTAPHAAKRYTFKQADAALLFLAR